MFYIRQERHFYNTRTNVISVAMETFDFYHPVFHLQISIVCLCELIRTFCYNNITVKCLKRLKSLIEHEDDFTSNGDLMFYIRQERHFYNTRTNGPIYVYCC
jgi:hypothetical protein